MVATAEEVARFIASSNKIIDEATAALRSQDKALLHHFEEFRRRLLSEIAVTDFSIANLNSLKFSVERAIRDLNLNLQVDLLGSLGAAAEAGGRAVIEPVKDLFGPVTLETVSGLSAPLVAVSMRFSADLIQNIADTLRKDINGLILRGVTSGQSSSVIIGRIAEKLTAAGANTYRNRAEAIFQTESMRVFSMAGDAQAQQVVQDGADVLKVWRWSGKARVNHAAIDGQVREVEADFNIPIDPGQTRVEPNITDYRGGEKARFPRWPGLSAANSIRCGCTFLLVSREVGMRLAARQGAIILPRTPVQPGPDTLGRPAITEEAL